MKVILTIFLLIFTNLNLFSQQDSISSQQLEIILLKHEIQNINTTFQKSESHLKQLIKEKDNQYELQYQKADQRLTNFIWTISIIVAVFMGILTFLGRDVLKKSIEKFFEKQSKELTSSKINSILTKEWLKEQVEEKSKVPVDLAVQELLKEFKETSEKIIDEEGEKMKAQSEIAREIISEIKEKRKELELAGLEQKTDDLKQEDKQKIQEYGETLEFAKDDKDFTANDWFWKARAEEEEGRHAEAIKLYTKSIKLDPERSVSWNNRGHSRAAIENYDEAILDFNKAIELNPRNFSALNNIGHTKNMQKEYIYAIDALTDALKINKTKFSIYGHRAFSYLMLDDLKNAIKDNDMALKLNSTYARAHFNSGLIKQKQNKLDEACIAWKKALELGFEEAQEKLDEFCVKG